MVQFAEVLVASLHVNLFPLKLIQLLTTILLLGHDEILHLYQTVHNANMLSSVAVLIVHESSIPKFSFKSPFKVTYQVLAFSRYANCIKIYSHAVI